MRVTIGLVLFTIAVSYASYANTNSIRVGVFEDQMPFFESLLADSDCPDYNQSDIGENQMLMEYLVICHVLKQGISDARFKLVGYPVVARLVDGLARSESDVSGFGIWFGESDNAEVVRSEPLMQAGQFSKGLFVNAVTHQRLQQDDDLVIQQLIAVSNENWTFDWQALQCGGLRVVHVDRYEQMFNLLAMGRADVLPMAFGAGNDLTRTEFGIQLYPVEGIKLVIPDSSHVLIAKGSEKSLQLIKAINNGLKQGRSDGSLSAKYMQTGVVNPLTSEWSSLCNQ